jgi:glycine cleavage system T protein
LSVFILYAIEESIVKKTPLHDIHSKEGAIFDDYSGWMMPKRFGNGLEEYLAVRKNVGIVDLAHRGKLRLSGREHIKFLQGMLTNDINKLEEGNGLYATLLTVKGRTISDMVVYRDRESILLDLEPGLNEKVREFLIKFRLSYRANIEDVTENLGLISIHGPSSKRLLEKVVGEEIPELNQYSFLDREINGVQVRITRINRTGEDGYDIYTPSNTADMPWKYLAEHGEEFHLKQVGLDAMETLRIEAAIPRYGVDIDENTIPIEAGLWHALSFEKGCYVGQEVIARIKWRGHVNRHLVGFELEGEDLPVSGDKINCNEREVGYITSSTFSPALKKAIALGVIRREFIEPGTKVFIKREEKNQPAQVVKTPFYRRSQLVIK